MGLPKLLVSGLIRVQSWGGYPKPNLLGQIRIPPKKIGPLSELSVFFFGGGVERCNSRDSREQPFDHGDLMTLPSINHLDLL